MGIAKQSQHAAILQRERRHGSQKTDAAETPIPRDHWDAIEQRRPKQSEAASMTQPYKKRSAKRLERAGGRTGHTKSRCKETRAAPGGIGPLPSLQRCLSACTLVALRGHCHEEPARHRSAEREREAEGQKTSAAAAPVPKDHCGAIEQRPSGANRNSLYDAALQKARHKETGTSQRGD